MERLILKGSKYFLFYCLKFIGFPFFCYILYRLNWSEFWAIFSRINLAFLILVLIIYPFIVFLKTYRWKLILKILGYSFNFKYCFGVWNACAVFSFFSPGKLGEFAKALMIKKKNVPYFKGVLSIIIDKFLDLFAYSFFIIFIINFLKLKLVFLVSLFFSLFLSLLFYFCFKKVKYFLFFSLKKKGVLIFLFFVSIFIGFLCLNRLFFLFSFVELNLSYFEILGLFALTELVSLMPLTVSGIGLREFVMFYFLSPLGVSMEEILSYSLLVYLLVIIIPAISSYFYSCFWGNKNLIEYVKK